jgi:hypothetical protein
LTPMFEGFILYDRCQTFCQFLLNKWNKARPYASLQCSGWGCTFGKKYYRLL